METTQSNQEQHENDETILAVAKSHDFIMQFMKLTDDHEEVTASLLKVTIAQILAQFGKELAKMAEFSPVLEVGDVYKIQIRILRQCILDLTICLNRDHEEVTIQ